MPDYLEINPSDTGQLLVRNPQTERLYELVYFEGDRKWNLFPERMTVDGDHVISNASVFETDNIFDVLV